MGRFPTLAGHIPECLNGPFSLLKIHWKQPIKKGGVKRFLIEQDVGPRLVVRRLSSDLFNFPCFIHQLVRVLPVFPTSLKTLSARIKETNAFLLNSVSAEGVSTLISREKSEIEEPFFLTN